jgi:predicted nucleotidyltransferase component of viral defense system
MTLPALSGLALVGGTALSLHFGHRKSIDLDLFGYPFQQDLIISELQREFVTDFTYSPTFGSKGLFCFIRDIKVDLISFEHPLVRPLLVESGIRMLAPEDLAAMKINAILSRANKKDFWDIHELLLHFSVADLIDFHQKKYPNQLLLISIPQALVYFEDAESSPNPICLKGLTWPMVKRSIQRKVNEFLI